MIVFGVAVWAIFTGHPWVATALVVSLVYRAATSVDSTSFPTSKPPSPPGMPPPLWSPLMKDWDVVPEPPEVVSEEDSLSSPFEYAGARLH